MLNKCTEDLRRCKEAERLKAVSPKESPLRKKRRTGLASGEETTRAPEARTHDVQQTPTPRRRAVRMDGGGGDATSMRASEALTQDAQNITPVRRTGTNKLLSPRYTGPPLRLMSPLGCPRGVGY